ncbi:hypothetical protein L1987_70733 [Smallanthus sonchifolius]|uniref:Uncharacterized protein n=1 Tax=Smallanthus sonchifolius TaxID=185202 RepID=A0ACB9APM1_9ASTR|nr:hypothetical protein L1987_70733 [Smallanthus sonchifolius]
MLDRVYLGEVETALNTLGMNLELENNMFDQMWDAIRSMKQDVVLSLTTLVSVFGRYCEAGKFSEAVMVFDLMKGYGLEHDVVAVNSLFSVICRDESRIVKAYEFFEKVKD